ncbi:hypothetical protein ACI3EY_03695 [Ornithinimicrobium sp. LYQ92]|uniref:hypothetical protein n=1 Tax=Serinicoccus sp. LYQ92 TaxID=3378798 RepID=UPI00385281F5
MLSLVRFQSAVPNRRGRFPGVFALANGLAHDGLLSHADHRWWESANTAMNAAYAHPTANDPTAYDPVRHPGATSWFKDPEAAGLIERAREYLELLDRYGVPWVELRTRTPGVVHYEDEVQVVSTAYQFAEHWPFAGRAPRG